MVLGRAREEWGPGLFSCGDLPPVLVFDGIAMGLQVKKVVDFRENEVASEVFPNFPRVNKRAEYEKNCTNEDKQSFKGICNKTYGKHKKLSPGLLIMTCACPQKVVYGFSLMLDGESPMMVFDIIMLRNL